MLTKLRMTHSGNPGTGQVRRQVMWSLGCATKPQVLSMVWLKVLAQVENQLLYGVAGKARSLVSGALLSTAEKGPPLDSHQIRARALANFYQGF